MPLCPILSNSVVIVEMGFKNFPTALVAVVFFNCIETISKRMNSFKNFISDADRGLELTTKIEVSRLYGYSL